MPPIAGRAGLSAAKRVPYDQAAGSLQALILLTENNVENSMALTLPAVVEQSTLPATMRSAVLFGPQDIRVIDRPVPRPGPGEVLVQVAMCGTCGTDLKIYDGHFPLNLNIFLMSIPVTMVCTQDNLLRLGTPCRAPSWRWRFAHVMISLHAMA